MFVAVSATLAVAAAGCGGGTKAPGVASLGPATTTTGGGGALPSPSAAPGSTKDFVSFVDCMQKHGIQAQLGQGGHGISITGGNPGSPQLQAAQKACQKLLPGGGPPTLTPAQQAEQLKELLKLATCMRTHGFPSFPDPNSQGGFDFSGSSGVDPSSAQFQSAMSECRPGNAKVPLRIGIRVGGSGPGKVTSGATP